MPSSKTHPEAVQTPAPFVAYYRLSRDGRGGANYGLDAQEAAVRRFVDGHASAPRAELVAAFVEIESGKAHQNRPELAAAMAECRRRRATLVIATLDRLARNVHFVSGLMESRVPFVAADMPSASPFELHIRAAMAEEERRKISQRTKAALTAAKARGVRLGNPRIDELNGPRIEARQAYARELAPLVAQLKAGGHRTLDAIRDELNRRGVATTTGRGSWHKPAVHQLLKRIEAAEGVAFMRDRPASVEASPMLYSPA